MTKTVQRAGAAALCLALSLSLTCMVPLYDMDAQAFAETSAEKQAEADEIAANIDALQTQLNEANAEYERANEEYEAATAAAKQAAKRAEEARERISELQGRLGERANDMYKTGGTMSFFEVLLGASSFSEFLTSWDALEKITGQDAELVQESKDARAEAEAAEAEYTAQKEKAAEEMANAKAAQDEIAVAKAAMEAELEKVNEEVALLQAKEEQEAIAAEEAKRREELAKQYTESLTGGSGGSGNSGSFSSTMSGWTNPCPGYYSVTCEFGYSPITGSHNGIDLGASSGTPIYSAGPGTVTYVGWYGTGGNSVIVSHGNGVRTIYMHQSQTAASVGQQVSAGTLIGYVGSTGLSTGPHLHFQIEVNGTPVNPRNFFTF